jgi:hypothetical protein
MTRWSDAPSQTAITKGWTSESGMPGEGLDTPGYGVKEPPNGRAVRGGPYLHQRTHPQPVDGCFGCRIASVSLSLPAHASTRGDGIGIASQLKEEHQKIAAASNGRFQPVGKRWV